MGYIKRTQTSGENIVTDDALKVVKAFVLPTNVDSDESGITPIVGGLRVNATTGRLQVWNPLTSLWNDYAKLSEAGGGGGGVSSVNGQVGDVVLTKADIGLSNVDNIVYYPNSNPSNFITASSSDNLTNKTGNISQWTNNAGYLTSVPAQSFASLTGKPTTLSGYGITDAYPLTGNPSGYITSSALTPYVPYTGATTDLNLGTNTFTGNSVTYNPITAPAHQRGKVFYDSGAESLSYYDDITWTSLNIGQESVLRARNNSGSTILNGQVVYITGATGQNPTIGLARADSLSTCEVIGVATHDIPNNTIGKVTSFGLVNDLNTSGFSDGNTLYLSATTAGSLVNTPPSSPNFSVNVGYVVYANPANGKVFVHPSRALALDTGLSMGGNSIPPSVAAVKTYADTKATLTSFSASSPLSYNNTTGAFTIQQATTSQNGYLSSTDWNTFNGKQGTISLTTTGTSGAATLIGNTLNIPNYASGGGSGTVTSVSVVSANGLAGTVATATTTPAITLSTTITGLLKGNGTAISAASSSTDYISPANISTGLTNTGGTVTNNLSTGVSGGQSVIGGTASGNNLTLSSTSNATKGKVFLNLAQTITADEVNVRFGVGTNSPQGKLSVGSSVVNPTTAEFLISDNTPSFMLERTNAGTDAKLWDFIDYDGLMRFRAINDANNAAVDWITATRSSANVPSVNIPSSKVFMGGTTTPTARLHIAAGTATANTAPLKLTSGTNLTTPEAGAIEFDGTDYYATVSTTRYTVPKTLKASATLDFPSTGSQTSSDLTITLTGAAVGNIVKLGVPNGSVPGGNCMYSAWVSATNTVTVRFNNYDIANAMNPASGTFTVAVEQ